MVDAGALAVAALECGHVRPLADEDVLRAAAHDAGLSVHIGDAGLVAIGLHDDALPDTDLLLGRVTISEHPLCALGAFIALAWPVDTPRPSFGSGAVQVAAVAAQVAARGWDGGPRLVGALRELHRLGLVEYREAQSELRVGARLATQPTSFWRSIEGWRSTVVRERSSDV